jgi:hypothetical protein
LAYLVTIPPAREPDNGALLPVCGRVGTPLLRTGAGSLTRIR